MKSILILELTIPNLLYFADLNPRLGTEPGKVRPVVVFQTDLLNQVNPSTLICPVTINIRRHDPFMPPLFPFKPRATAIELKQL